MNCENKNFLPSICLGLLLLFGLWGLGSSISEGLSHQVEKDRTINVKGIAEKVIYADKAIYPISYVIRGYDLNAVAKKMDKDSELVLNLLREIGFSDEAITISQPRLAYDVENIPNNSGYKARMLSSNSMANEGNVLLMAGGLESASPTVEAPKKAIIEENQVESEVKEEVKVDSPLYILSKKITVRIDDMEKIKMISEKLDALIHAGVNLYGNNQVQYIFSKLEATKASMFEEATQNGIILAKNIAKTSNSELGFAKRINLGQAMLYNDDYEPNKKKVVVENYLEFFLVD